MARLHPTHAQWAALEAETRAGRWVWNRTIALGRRLRRHGHRLTFARACARLTRWRQRRPWLADGSVVVQQQIAKAATDALAAWAAGTARRPRFKSARRGDPVGLRYTARGLGALSAHTVALAKLGPVRHGATRALGPVSSVDVTRDRRGWRISFRERVAPVALKPLPSTTAEEAATIGLDFGIAQSWTLSDGTHIHLPVVTPPVLARVRQLDRAMAKRRRGKGERPSRRYDAARAERAALQRTLVGQRRDLLTKLAKRLCATHAVVAVEDLRLAAMTARARGKGRAAKAGLNRALLHQSRGLFLRALSSAAQRTGTHLPRVPAPYTSQTCPTCDHVASANRESQAVFRCQACGYTGHADTVASEIIRRQGVARVRHALARPEVSYLPGDDTPNGEVEAARARPMNRAPAQRAAHAA